MVLVIHCCLDVLWTCFVTLIVCLGSSILRCHFAHRVLCVSWRTDACTLEEGNTLVTATDSF